MSKYIIIVVVVIIIIIIIIIITTIIIIIIIIIEIFACTGARIRWYNSDGSFDKNYIFCIVTTRFSKTTLLNMWN